MSNKHQQNVTSFQIPETITQMYEVKNALESKLGDSEMSSNTKKILTEFLSKTSNDPAKKEDLDKSIKEISEQKTGEKISLAEIEAQGALGKAIGNVYDSPNSRKSISIS